MNILLMIAFGLIIVLGWMVMVAMFMCDITRWIIKKIRKLGRK